MADKKEKPPKLYCTRCGKRMVKKEVKNVPFEISTEEKFAWWIDPSTETVLQSGTFKRMKMNYFDTYDANNGKRVVQEIMVFPKSELGEINHDTKKVCYGIGGIYFN